MRGQTTVTDMGPVIITVMAILLAFGLGQLIYTHMFNTFDHDACFRYTLSRAQYEAGNYTPQYANMTCICGANEACWGKVEAIL